MTQQKYIAPQTKSILLYMIPLGDSIVREMSCEPDHLSWQSVHRLIWQTQPAGDLTVITIDVSTLPCGVYVVKLVGETGAQVGKFLKQ
jgi:hypothetical protein